MKILVSGPTTFCEGGSVTLNVPPESGTSFQWFRDTIPIGTDTSSIVVNKLGAYSVQATNQCGEPRHSDTVHVSVKPAPAPPSAKDSVSCGPGKVMLTASGALDGNYRWYVNDTIQNHIEGQVNSHFETPVLDTTTTYYVSIMEDKCESIRIPVQAIILDSSISSDDIEITPDGPTTFCEEGSVTLSIPPEISTSFQWFQNGNPIGSNSNLLTVSESGAYTIQFINSCDLPELIKDTVQAIVNTIPSPPIIADTLLCGVSSARIQATGQAEVFKWYASANDTDVLHQSADGIFVTPQLNTSTPFWVSALNGDCESNRTMATVFIDLTSAQAGNDTTIQAGESVQLQASGGNSYQWSPSQWLNNNNVADPIATPPEDVIYTVAATSHTGCVFEDEIVITVIPVANKLIIPNTITPNGDGLNDTWIITNIQHFQGNNVLIFDRTGRQLLEFTNYQQSWDGTVQGNPLPSDTYFYIIDRRNGTPQLKGPITIIR